MVTAYFLIRITSVLLLGSTSSWAAFHNRQLLPLGDREVLIANTGVAGNPSAGAVYYNPAGLALLQYPSISLSGSTYLYSESEISPLVRADNTNLNYKASGFNTIPAMVTSAWKWRETTLAFSVLVPDSLKLEHRQTFLTTNTRTTLDQIQSNNDLWVAFSLGRFVFDRWAIGLTVFAMQHMNSSSLILTIRNLASQNTASVSHVHLKTSVYNAAATLGIRWQVTDFFDLGLRVQSRALRLSGSADGYRYTQTVVELGALNIQEKEQKEIAASYPLPTDATIGTKLRLGNLSLLFDVSVQEGITYDLYPGSDFSFIEQLNSTFRYNFGAELELSPSFTLCAGWFINPSAIHSVRGRPEGTISQTFYGATGGVSFISGRVRTGLGIYYSQSLGNVVPYGDTQGEGSVTQTGAGGMVVLSYYF